MQCMNKPKHIIWQISITKKIKQPQIITFSSKILLLYLKKILRVFVTKIKKQKNTAAQAQQRRTTTIGETNVTLLSTGS